MARLRYYPTPADLAGAFGESVPLLGADGVTPLPGNPTGRLFAATEASVSFQVCTADDIGDVTTDLLADGVAATTWDTSEDFATLGRGPVLEGPDGHVGPLYLTADSGTTFYRIEPDSTGLYGRVGDLEAPKSIKSLSDVADTNPTNGQVLVFNNSTGQWTPSAAAGTGTVTSVNTVPPAPGGDVTLTPANVGAATAADMATAKANLLYRRLAVGGAYPAAVAGWASAPMVFVGDPAPPATGPDGDLWAQPQETP